MTPAEHATRRTRARRGRGDDLRGEILAATDKLLLETGDDQAVSIRAIADAVGVTPPSIYLHFPDKDSLIFAVCSRYFEDFVARLAPPGSDTSDPVAYLRRMAVAYVNFGRDRPEAYRVMFMGHGKHIPADVDPAEFPGHRAFELLVSSLAAGMDAGALERSDPVTAAISVWSGIHGLTSLLIALPEFPWPPVEQMVEQLCAVQIRGLARS